MPRGAGVCRCPTARCFAHRTDPPSRLRTTRCQPGSQPVRTTSYRFTRNRRGLGSHPCGRLAPSWMTRGQGGPRRIDACFRPSSCPSGLPRGGPWTPEARFKDSARTHQDGIEVVTMDRVHGPSRVCGRPGFPDTVEKPWPPNRTAPRTLCTPHRSLHPGTSRSQTGRWVGSPPRPRIEATREICQRLVAAGRERRQGHRQAAPIVGARSSFVWSRTRVSFRMEDSV